MEVSSRDCKARLCSAVVCIFSVLISCVGVFVGRGRLDLIRVGILRE